MDYHTQKPDESAAEIERVPEELTSSPLAAAEPTSDTEAESIGRETETPVPDKGGNAAEFARANHKYIREFIQLADQKSAVVITIGTALLAYLFERDLTEQWLRPLQTWEFTSFISSVAMIAIALAVLTALAVVVPRLKGASDGLIFWSAIDRFESSAEYADAVLIEDDEHRVHARLEHCYELAKVCNRKYRTLNWSIRIGAVGLGASVLYLLFLR